MEIQNLVITLLGSSGGLAKAILAILNKSIDNLNDPIHSHIRNSTIHLIDKKQKQIEYYADLFPSLKTKLVLNQFDLGDLVRFKKHLVDTNTSLVIDVSWADTIEMLSCCNELGISYVNTALENSMVDENEELEGFTLIERHLLFEENRSSLTNVRSIICSGMNPGVVQWMAIELMKQTPDEMPLACYIVEHDSSFYKDRSLVQEKTIYSTWSPECFLDEAILNYPMFVMNHQPIFIYKDVYELEFKVSLGEKQFYGSLMPHEEVLSLGKLFNMESGFIYRVNEFTTEAIRANLDSVDDLWEWHHQILDPKDAELEGEDLVGILLVYKDKEQYMYNVMNNQQIFPLYKTNATYFQVACGLYAAISSILIDDFPKGVYYVDELLINTETNYGKYLFYYMQEFVTGVNNTIDGLLFDRLLK